MPIDENSMPEDYRAWLSSYRTRRWAGAQEWPCPSCKLTSAFYWRNYEDPPAGKWRCFHCDPPQNYKMIQVTAGEERQAQPASAKELLDEPDLFGSEEGEKNG